jgi:hypothetical protein
VLRWHTVGHMWGHMSSMVCLCYRWLARLSVLKSSMVGRSNRRLLLLLLLLFGLHYCTWMFMKPCCYTLVVCLIASCNCWL